MVVFFVIGVKFPGFDNESIITGAINRTADANPVGALGQLFVGVVREFVFLMFLFHLYDAPLLLRIRIVPLLNVPSYLGTTSLSYNLRAIRNLTYLPSQNFV